MRTVRCVAILLLVLVGLTARGLVTSAEAASSQRVALLIANSNYPDGEGELPALVADARLLADALKRQDFTVDIAENLTKEGMQGAVDRFLRKIEPGSVALLFYSGYAIQVARKNYLIPTDARIWSEQDVPRDGFSVDGLLADIAKRGANTRVTILDASRRNPFERRYRSFSTGLAPATATPGAITLFSAAAGALVNETSTSRSPFMAELIKQIGTPNLSAEQAFRNTRDSVSKATRSQQLPALAVGLVEHFSFDPAMKAPPSGGKPSGTKLPPDPVDPPGDKPVIDDPWKDPEKPPKKKPLKDEDDAVAKEEVARDFDAAAQIGTKSAYEDFLTRHPTGSYADRARSEIARIEAAARPDRPKPEKEKEKEPEKEKEKEPEKEKEQPKPPKPYTSAELKRKSALDARIAKDSRDALAYYERGQFFAQRGESDLAITDFDQSLKLNSNNPEALNNRCWMRAVANDLEGALDDCNLALKLRPNFVDALDSRGFVHLKVGADRAAIDDYDAALRVQSSHSSAYYGRGIARRRLGQTSQADRDFTKALELNPTIDKEFEVYGLR